MVLHAHPVNQAREAAGLPVVNSLWPWGGGRLPNLARIPPAAMTTLWSDDPVARGIARLLGIDAPLPSRLGQRRGAPAAGILRRPGAPARSGDAIAWRDALARFEAGWLAPALAALRSGRLGACACSPPANLAAPNCRSAAATCGSSGASRARWRPGAMTMTRITVRDIPPRATWALEQGGVHPLLARLYAARGIRGMDELDTRSSALLPPDR
jgi:hypothetical protein